MKKVIAVSLDESLTKQIDELRGDVSRSKFVGNLLVKALNKSEKMEGKQ